MRAFAKLILTLSLILPFFGQAQGNEEEISRLNKVIAQTFKQLASVRDTKQASFNGVRIYPTIERIKSLIEERAQLTGISMTREESIVLNGDTESQRIRAQLLSTREGVESEIKRLSPLLETYGSDVLRLGIVQAELANLYIKLASMI